MTEQPRGPDARIKSLFILPAVGVSVLIFIAGLVMAFVDEQQRVAWLGAALASVSLPLTVGRIMWMQVARTSDTLPFLMFVTAAGVMTAVWETFIEGTAGWMPRAPVGRSNRNSVPMPASLSSWMLPERRVTSA